MARAPTPNLDTLNEPMLPPGFTARGVNPDADSEAVLALCDAAAIAEYGVSDATLQAIRESYGMPGFDPATDGRLVFDASGALAGVVEFYDNDEHHVAPFVFTRVRPDLLNAGIGEALLDWAAGRGRLNLTRAAPDLRVALHSNVAGVNRRMQEIYERSGWRQQRIYWEMEIELEAEPSVPPLPAGITIRTAGEDANLRAIYEATEEAFADHFGYVPMSFDIWLQFMTKFNSYDSSLWFLAVDGPEIAGTSLCLIEQRGRPESGWVSTLGVRRAWRGRGVGLALLRTSFAELYRRGKRRVALGVDSESLTGATRLYERAGMSVARDSREYELLLRGGRELRTV